MEVDIYGSVGNEQLLASIIVNDVLTSCGVEIME